MSKAEVGVRLTLSYMGILRFSCHGGGGKGGGDGGGGGGGGERKWSRHITLKVFKIISLKKNPLDRFFTIHCLS